jgi:hypothetical protein
MRSLPYGSPPDPKSQAFAPTLRQRAQGPSGKPKQPFCGRKWLGYRALQRACRCSSNTTSKIRRTAPFTWTIFISHADVIYPRAEALRCRNRCSGMHAIPCLPFASSVYGCLTPRRLRCFGSPAERYTLTPRTMAIFELIVEVCLAALVIRFPPVVLRAMPFNGADGISDCARPSRPTPSPRAAEASAATPSRLSTRSAIRDKNRHATQLLHASHPAALVTRLPQSVSTLASRRGWRARSLCK